ncbi:hypothetical protein ACFZAU_01260 [Streptomyces sp. NPDC008238]
MITPDGIWEAAGLPARRLAGLALNPAAPEDVLLRLLADGPPAARMVLCRDRTLPDAVVDAVVRHPDRYTRSFLARSPHAEPAQRARLLDRSGSCGRTWPRPPGRRGACPPGRSRTGPSST